MVLTLNLRASLSYGFGILSTSALALQICTNEARSSVEMELCGLPGRTNAWVPVLEVRKAIRERSK